MHGKTKKDVDYEKNNSFYHRLGRLPSDHG